VIQCNIRDIRARKAAADERERLWAIAKATRGDSERANRTKNEFLAMVSHELRAPLHNILVWTQLLLRMKDNPQDLATGLDAIARSVRAQTRLIDDLGDVSRIGFGKFSCDDKPVDVVQVVSAAIEAARPIAHEKRIDLELSGATSEVVVNGDPGRLHQVFGNLLFNALKFTPAGGKVEVTVVPQDADMEIRIRDSGMGISPKILPWIFDRFRQSEAPTVRKHGGLGLGLAIAKEIVALHGGTVRAESQGEGQGATFSVKLPLARTKKGENGANSGQSVGIEGLACTR